MTPSAKWLASLACWLKGHAWKADDGGSTCRLTEGFDATCARCGKAERQPSHCERIGIDLSESPEDYLRRVRADIEAGRPVKP